MTTLAITRQKGGVGKTTIAVNLSYSLARRGWQVLLVDADPQGGVGLSLTRKSSRARGFFNLMNGSGPSETEQMVLSTRLPEFKLLLSGGVEGYLDSPESKNSSTIRERFTEVIDRFGSFDVVIIDTPAGVHGLTAELIRCVDFLLLPQQAEPLSARSIPHLLRTIARIRKEPGQNGLPKLAGLLLTMVRHDDPVSLEVQQEIREMLPSELVLDSEIPRDSEFPQASRSGVPIALLRRQPPAAAMRFDQLAAEIEERIDLKHPEETSADEYTRLMD